MLQADAPADHGDQQGRGFAVFNDRLRNAIKGSNDDLFGRTRTYGSWAAYGNSKLALAHMSTEIQRRYASSAHLQAYFLHPGSVFTKVADKGLEGIGWAEKLRTALAPIEAFFLKSPEEGAQTSIHCATAPKA